MFLRGMVRRLAEKKARGWAMPKSPEEILRNSSKTDDGDHGWGRRHGRGGRSNGQRPAAWTAAAKGAPRCGPRVYARDDQADRR